MIVKKHYGAIYIPAKFGALAQQVAKRFAEVAGGATTEQVTGNWIMKGGELCNEPILKVGVSFSEHEAPEIRTIRFATIKVLIVGGEEAVATEGSSPGKGCVMGIYTKEDVL